MGSYTSYEISYLLLSLAFFCNNVMEITELVLFDWEKDFLKIEKVITQKQFCHAALGGKKVNVYYYSISIKSSMIYKI